MKYSMNDAAVLKKVDDLLSKMSLTEKIGQLIYIDGNSKFDLPLIESAGVGTVANVFGAKNVTELQKRAVNSSPHRIPLLLISDVIQGYKTIFPIPLAESCSFDPELAERTATALARESQAAGTSWIAGPMVDVARDPRWGRVAESSGEDTYLNSVMGAARVRGINNIGGVCGCAKHFAAYGSAVAGRDYNTSLISENELRNVYLPPFKACIDAGVQSIMISFNDTLGVPMTANKYLLQDVLRGEMGFDGWLATDYNAIVELITHGVAANRPDACIKAVDAGVELDMASGVFLSELEKLVKSGDISEEVIDKAAARVLYLKFALGLFDRYSYDEQYERDVILCDEHKALARESAQKSIVLLKNNSVLPLDKNKKILVIGPLADDNDAPLGWWRCQGSPEDVITVLDGIKSQCKNISFVEGCNALGLEPIDKDEIHACDCDAIVTVVGEPAFMSGESHCRTDITLPGRQAELIKFAKSLNKPLVTVLVTGRPLDITAVDSASDAVLCAWEYGISGNAVSDILFGDVSPSAKLSISFPLSVGQVPIYYAHKNTGRPYNGQPFEMSKSVTSFAQDYTSHYIDMPNTPLYPFGHGLSYTEFEYSDIAVGKTEYPLHSPVLVSAKIKNTGARDGVEIVQVYVHDVSAEIACPVKELKAFRRVALKAGEQKTVEFILDDSAFSYCNSKNQTVVDKGEFEIFVAGSSQDGMPVKFRFI